VNEVGDKVRNMRITHTKQSLIEAFVQLVNQKDFEKITIADLTKIAKVNRSTFYSHFNDKYELLDFIVNDSASTVIENRTLGIKKFDEHMIFQLVLAVCDYHQQPNIQCRSSYLSLIPLLKEKMIVELKKYLSDSLEPINTDINNSFYVPIYANLIHEAGYLWASGQASFEKEEIARKVSLIVSKGKRNNSS